MFPPDNIWNVRIDEAPLHPNSDNMIEFIGEDTGLKADFGSDFFEGALIGLPINYVDNSTDTQFVPFLFDDESDVGPYPIPDDVVVEGDPIGKFGGDRHMLMVNTDTCILYEIFDAQPDGDGWTAGSGAIFNLNTNELRTDTWTSADAAGLPILPGLVRWDEIVVGVIDHALRFTVPDTREVYVWPARHKTGNNEELFYPRMGERFRLRSTFDISGYSQTNQIIMTALQRYGIIVADNGACDCFCLFVRSSLG